MTDLEWAAVCRLRTCVSVCLFFLSFFFLFLTAILQILAIFSLIGLSVTKVRNVSVGAGGRVTFLFLSFFLSFFLPASVFSSFLLQFVSGWQYRSCAAKIVSASSVSVSSVVPGRVRLVTPRLRLSARARARVCVCVCMCVCVCVCVSVSVCV